MLNFNTPKCLEQCYSCTKTGTDEKHACLQCVNDSYYIEDYDDAVNEGYGKPHNCERCNESCYNCYKQFELEPSPNTNCKKCDYENGYYHYFKDQKICISEGTQEYWEKDVFHRAIYLDKNSTEDKTKKIQPRIKPNGGGNYVMKIVQNAPGLVQMKIINVMNVLKISIFIVIKPKEMVSQVHVMLIVSIMDFS